ncbi:hypothetical protein K4K61_002832 [Colletotrichum sp. SAR11_59]|nr:hypothetical protein K4K61_002832 [Colletotrichum sp. SAR11_59]
MACVQLNHSIPHRNSFHPGDYIVDNRRHGVLKSLQGIHLDKPHLGCSNWQHYGYWCNHGDGVSNRHHSLAKCEHYVELSTEHDSVSKQWDNFEYLNVECDSQHHIGRVFYNRRSSVSNRQLLCRSLPDWVQYIEHLAFNSHVDPCYTRRNRNRGHRRSHSDRNLFYCQFYETITFLTTLPVGELLSSSEHNHYYLWNRHHGNIDIDGRYFQYQLYHLLVAASIPGHELYFISVYLGQHNGDIEWSQRHGNDAAIPCWQCHRDPGIDWQRNCHPVAEFNILVASIFVVVVFASVPSYWVFDYSCHCHQLNRADGVFNTMPYGHRNQWHSNPSHHQKCSSLIHANLHVQVAEHDLYKALNRSYKQTFQQHRHNSHHINDQDFVSDFTLPSNKAYPWGGNGPLFRRPNTTASDSEEVPVRQPGGWWLRWKRHFDRSRSGPKESEAGGTYDS